MVWLQIAILIMVILLLGAVTLLLRQWRGARSGLFYASQWRERHFRSRWNFPLFDIIERAELDAGIRLTWGAREMLAIPVIETIEARGDVSWSVVDSSIRDVVRTMAEERGPEESSERRNSISAIRAFWRRFCNIPPFCSRTDEAPQ